MLQLDVLLLDVLLLCVLQLDVLQLDVLHLQAVLGAVTHQRMVRFSHQTMCTTAQLNSKNLAKDEPHALLMSTGDRYRSRIPGDVY